MASVEAGGAISDQIGFEANNSNGTASLEQHPAVNSQKMATIEHNFANKVDMSEGKPENVVKNCRKLRSACFEKNTFWKMRIFINFDRVQ